MYVCISTLKKVAAGDVLVLEKEYEFGEIAVREIGGEIVGFALHSQPEGCIDFATAIKNIASKKIIARVALNLDDAAVLHSESTVLLPTVKGDYLRINSCYL